MINFPNNIQQFLTDAMVEEVAKQKGISKAEAAMRAAAHVTKDEYKQFAKEALESYCKDYNMEISADMIKGFIGGLSAARTVCDQFGTVTQKMDDIMAHMFSGLCKLLYEDYEKKDIPKKEG